MARINIDDSLFSDKRFIKLQRVLGYREGLGAIVEAWVVAQKFHSVENPKAPIPLSKWHEQELAQEIIDCNLATIDGDFVYLRGAEDQFNWLLKSKINGAKGGRPPKVEPEIAANLTEEQDNPRVSLGNPQVSEPNPSGPLFSSLLSSAPLIKKNTKKNTVTSSPKSAPRDGGLIKHFCDRWKEKRPGPESYKVGGKGAKLMVTMVNEHGPETVRRFIDAYFTMGDAYVTRRGHTIELLYSNLNQVAQYINTGKVVTSSAARELEEKVDEAQGQGKVDYAEVVREYEAQRKLQLVGRK